MLFHTIFTLLWAAAFAAALPSFSLSRGPSSHRHVNDAQYDVQAVSVAEVPETSASSSPVIVQGAYCGQAPIPEPEPSNQGKAKEEPAGPTQTLAPSVHWSWDTRPLKNVEPVAPKQDSAMYYGAPDPDQEGYFAFLTYRFIMPSVNLDHSAHVEAEYTKDQNMKIVFKTSESFQRAVDSWDTKNDLLLIAHADGCTGSSSSDRCYFRATSLAFDEITLTIVGSGSPESPEKLIDSAETEWGYWAPHNRTGGNLTAPADKSLGLVTAAFGPTFDRSLDDQLGYHELQADSQSFLQEMINEGGFATSTGRCSDKTQGELHQRRVLRPRGFLGNAWHGFVGSIKSAYRSAADLLSIKGDFSQPVSWDLPGPDVAREASPWSDNSIALFKHGEKSDSVDFDGHINIYCVDCDVSGQAILSGKAQFTPLAGIFDGEVALQADLRVALKVGVDADIQYRQTIQKDLFAAGLPGLSYGIVTMGPYISVAANVGLEAAASGKLLIGAELGISQASAVLSISEPSKSTAVNWTPYFKPVLEAEGEIMLAASAALPISIKVGLKVASFETALGLTEEPALSAVAQFAGTADYSQANGFTAAFKDFNGCAGIMTSIAWSNKLTLDVLGAANKVLHDTGKQPILSHCLNFNKSSEAKKRAVGSLSAVQNSIVDAPQRFANVTAPSNTSTAVPASNDTAKNSSCNEIDQRSGVFKNGHRFDLVSLLTSIGTSMVASCNDGNMYVTAASNQTNNQCSTMWPASGEAVIPFDGSLNVMHYYASSMDAVGVSRMRSSPEHKMPKDAVVAVLAPAPDADGSSFYMAVDKDQRVFYPIVCDFVDKAVPRVFLAKDLSAGIKMLEGGSVVESVTGAEVEKCFGLSLSPQL